MLGKNHKNSSQKVMKKPFAIASKQIVLGTVNLDTLRSPLKSSLRSQSIPRPVSSPYALQTRQFKFQKNSFSACPDLESWKHSQGYSKSVRVFIIQGDYPELKKALQQKGWVENPDIRSLHFNLLWARSAKFPSKLQDWQIINHFPRNFEISAKWNFCENIKKLKHFYDIDHLNFYPRCYRVCSQEIEDFVNMFKLNKAISILKSYLLLKKSNSNEKLFTCMKICRRWCFYIEKNTKSPNEKFLVHPSEWKVINSNYLYEIQNEFKRIHKENVQDSTISLESVQESLLKLEQLDPQYHISGTKDIWIVKPGRKSRGREIMLFNNLEDIKNYTQNPQQWVIQKYIENPMLINNKKFDIRQWVLVSNCEPLTIWVYKYSYLRFTVENYDSSDLTNQFIHLTNNSISKHSQKFSKSEIAGCMWHISQFIEYLTEKYNKNYWEEVIFPKICEIVKWSLVSIGNLGRKNCFEVFGYDFMIDNKLKPWLLEVNSSPAMDYSTVIKI
jgi:tubulin monoglycylase TTLL3/8